MLFCENCGAVNEAEAKFCVHCGSRIGEGKGNPFYYRQKAALDFTSMEELLAMQDKLEKQLKDLDANAVNASEEAKRTIYEANKLTNAAYHDPNYDGHFDQSMAPMYDPIDREDFESFLFEDGWDDGPWGEEASECIQPNHMAELKKESGPLLFILAGIFGIAVLLCLNAVVIWLVEALGLFRALLWIIGAALVFMLIAGVLTAVVRYYKVVRERKKLKEALRAENERLKSQISALMDAFGLGQDAMEKIVMLTDQFSKAGEEKSDELVEKIRGIVDADRDKLLYRKKEADMEKLLSPVYRMLSEESKSFLITGTLIRDKLANQSDCDFSSVCILLSKAVEAEFKKRYFDSYKTYLFERFSDKLSDWPYVMLYRNRIKTICTLGDFPFIMGVKQLKEDLSPSRTRSLFFDYARGQQLKAEGNDEQLKAVLSEQALSLEQIRTQFRNPSAHAQKKSLADAQACMDLLLFKDQLFIRLMEVFKA